MKILRGLVAAFGQFSILPVPTTQEAPDAYSIGWLPLVGAVIGYAAGWGAYGTFLLTHSQMWCALTAFALSVILTGAIHIDGFLDSCDALLATTTVERRLEILKDPRHGTYAIVGMALLTVVWLASLYGIPAASMPIVLALVGLLSRAFTLYSIAAYPHARTGNVMRLLQFPALAWSITSFSLSRHTDAFAGFFIIGLLANEVWAWILSRRLGGKLTGDVYGALIVITEVALLKTLAIFPALLP